MVSPTGCVNAILILGVMNLYQDWFNPMGEEQTAFG